MIESLKDRFPALIREVEAINYAWGWPGMLDSLEYIGNRFSEYEGTRVGAEYKVFITEMHDFMANSTMNSAVV